MKWCLATDERKIWCSGGAQSHLELIRTHIHAQHGVLPRAHGDALRPRGPIHDIKSKLTILTYSDIELEKKSKIRKIEKKNKQTKWQENRYDQWTL